MLTPEIWQAYNHPDYREYRDYERDVTRLERERSRARRKEEWKRSGLYKFLSTPARLHDKFQIWRAYQKRHNTLGPRLKQLKWASIGMAALMLPSVPSLLPSDKMDQRDTEKQNTVDNVSTWAGISFAAEMGPGTQASWLQYKPAVPEPAPVIQTIVEAAQSKSLQPLEPVTVRTETVAWTIRPYDFATQQFRPVYPTKEIDALFETTYNAVMEANINGKVGMCEALVANINSGEAAKQPKDEDGNALTLAEVAPECVPLLYSMTVAQFNALSSRKSETDTAEVKSQAATAPVLDLTLKPAANFNTDESSFSGLKIGYNLN